MVDDGYLIGYEDTNGDFVEVGRFNNQAEDTNQPVEIVHTGSGEKVELGPGGFDANNITANSVNTASTSINENGFAYTPTESLTESFASGETKPNTIIPLSLSDLPVIAVAVPANDPGNDHGYRVDSIYWDNSSSVVRVKVTETEDLGGGEADIFAWSISPERESNT